MITYEKLSNGKVLKAKIFSLTFKLSKLMNLPEDSMRKLFLFQLNRFENGRVTIFFSFFFRYSLTIYGIKLSEGKRYFLGNKQNKR